MKLTDAQQQALADRLFESVRAGQGIDPPSNTLDYDFDDAYRVRRKLVDHLIAAGGRPKGHKIGFTSEAMQKMYGMTGPDFGILLDNMFTPQDQPVRVSHLSNTRAEPELAFELSRPLEGKVTIEDVLAATARIWAAVEVIDSRVGAMKAKANDSLADNAGAGWVILSETSMPPSALPLADIMMRIDIDGTVQEAKSGDVMGHPAAPLAWLANKLAPWGESLQAGQVVLAGSFTRPVAAKRGDRFDADYGPLGRFTFRFV
mgnify:CR=1 FL=1